MHLGVIPDGNRRYARNNGIENKEAYKEAKDVIKQIGEQLEKSSNFEVNEVSFYLLSEENLERDGKELETLFDLLEEHVGEVSSSFNRNGFELNWATTNPGALPEDLRRRLEELEEKFDDGDKKLNLLISYSGKQDILSAAEQVSGNGEDFTRESLSGNLEINSEIDFVIRTGDNPHRECLSGFPIWNASYAEFYHIKKNFPAIEPEDVEKAFDHYRDLRKKRGK